MVIPPGAFFIFLKFLFFGILKNYIRHMPYPRNSIGIAYDHDFWFHLCKMMLSPGVFFHFFKILILWAVRGWG